MKLEICTFGFAKRGTILALAHHSFRKSSKAVAEAKNLFFSLKIQT